MTTSLSRREMLRGSVALAALALARHPLEAFGFDRPGERETVLPFLEAQPPGKMLRWEELTQWQTPSEELFAVSHYGIPTVNLNDWRLGISGLVGKPRLFSLQEIKARKRKSITATLECSGNSSAPGFMGAIGNVTWTGTPLAPLLQEAHPAHRAIEVVFYGADQKTEKIREKEYPQHFARSLSLSDALNHEVLLAYEMNGEPLTTPHGAPVRLIVPGWFGIAWVKWLTRIELLDRRFMSKFMGRDYVTIRGEERDGETIWRETSVGPIDVKSIIARAVRTSNGGVRISGAAWTDGAALKRVEVKIDDGSWQTAELRRKRHSPFAWTFFEYLWKNPTDGEHVLQSRALDSEGRIQPSADDPEIKMKRTYWEANQQLPRKIRIDG